MVHICIHIYVYIVHVYIYMCMNSSELLLRHLESAELFVVKKPRREGPILSAKGWLDPLELPSFLLKSSVILCLVFLLLSTGKLVDEVHHRERNI